MARSHSIEAAGGILPFLDSQFQGGGKRFLELYKAGKSDSEIARAFSTVNRQRTRETARQWRLRYEREQVT
jgi:hypothetical protein